MLKRSLKEIFELAEKNERKGVEIKYIWLSVSSSGSGSAPLCWSLAKPVPSSTVKPYAERCSGASETAA